MTTDDTDPIDLDGEEPLSPVEITRLRRIARDYDRASWAVRRLIPYAAAVAVGAWQLWDWASRHLRIAP